MYRLNWARKTSEGIYDTVIQTQDWTNSGLGWACYLSVTEALNNTTIMSAINIRYDSNINLVTYDFTELFDNY